MSIPYFFSGGCVNIKKYLFSFAVVFSFFTCFFCISGSAVSYNFAETGTMITGDYDFNVDSFVSSLCKNYSLNESDYEFCVVGQNYYDKYTCLYTFVKLKSSPIVFTFDDSIGRISCSEGKYCFFSSFRFDLHDSADESYYFGNRQSNEDVFMYSSSSSGSPWFIRQDFSIYDKDGEIVNPGSAFNASVVSNGDYTLTAHVDTKLDEELKVYIYFYNQSTSEPCEATRINYEALNGIDRTCTKNKDFDLIIDLQDFKDKCQDMKSYSPDIFVELAVFSASVDYDRFFPFNVETLRSESTDDGGLFDDKKDYLPLPDVDDYLTDYPDFPGWDSEHPLDSIWEIIKWIGSCVIVLGKNIVGLFHWLWDVFGVCFQNIGIALYNLIVDLRRLIIYLFVPSSKDLNIVIDNKFPAFKKIQSAVTAAINSSSSSMTFSIFDETFVFDFSDLPSALKSTLFNGSTICMYVIQIFMIVRMLSKCFGVNVGGEINDN